MRLRPVGSTASISRSQLVTIAAVGCFGDFCPTARRVGYAPPVVSRRIRSSTPCRRNAGQELWMLERKLMIRFRETPRGAVGGESLSFC